MNYLDILQIDKETPKKLTEKIALHRARFSTMFKARYLELLPSLIKYQNSTSIAVDFQKVEIALRQGYDIVIGETADKKIMVLGYTNSNQTIENPSDLFNQRLLRQTDINFIIPKRLMLPWYREISMIDNCQSGNFVVLRNKNLQYINDYMILDHYVDELTEIVLSRYSLIMQVKISNIFIGEAGDESINQIISDIYNGNPYIKSTKLFDPVEQIYEFKNEGVAQNFQELKREYQNKISELNNMLGIHSLAVEKSSGVSDEEAKSNRGFTTSNSNIYLDSRNHGLKKLNKRFNLKIQALYNDEVLSEFSELSRKEESENHDNSHDQNL